MSLGHVACPNIPLSNSNESVFHGLKRWERQIPQVLQLQNSELSEKKKFPSPFLLLKSHSMKTQLHLDPIFACAGAAAGATAGAAAGDGGTAAGAAAAGAGAAGRTFGSLSSLGSSTTWRCWGRPNQVIRGTSNSRSLGHQSGHLWWNRLQRQGLFVATPSHLRRWRWRGTDQDFGVQGRWPFRDDDLWAPWDPQKREIYSRYSSHFNGR